MNCRPLLIIVLVAFLASNLNAQEYTIDSVVNRNLHLYASPYKYAIGVKMYPSAISYKKFFAPNKAIETLGYFTLDGFRATIIYEKYHPVEGNENLTWYAGYGGHLGIWSEEWKKNNPAHNAGIALGIDGILGLDYKLKNAPLNISVDWQPSFNFVGASYFESGWAGLGVRYTF
jgi:hypothetical protein